MTKMNLVAEPGMHSVIVTREFNAPRELVYRAFIDPDLIPRWWGSGSATTTVEKLEPKKGGVWHFVQHAPDGNQYGFHGVFHELASPERLIYTFEFEGMPGHVLLETIELEDRGGKTFITDTSIFQSVADRDGMLQAGMAEGTTDSWERLDVLLKTM